MTERTDDGEKGALVGATCPEAEIDDGGMLADRRKLWTRILPSRRHLAVWGPHPWGKQM